jgi:predicted ester cyclase
MTPERTREVMAAYLEGHDVSKIAADAVFTEMATGHETRGRQAIEQMLHYVYEEAFDATYELKHLVIASGQAAFETDLVGRHLMEVSGIPPTGGQVRVPFCVVYDLDNDLITRARIYFETDALRQPTSVI